MKNIFMLVLLLSSFSAFAASPNEVCDSIRTNPESTMCFDIISMDEGFEDTALNVCNNLLMGDTTVKCLRTISGASFQTEAASLCGILKNDGQIVICMETIRNKEFDLQDLSRCKGNEPIVGIGPKKAINTCLQSLKYKSL